MNNADDLLNQIPNELRDPLLKSYREIASNYIESRWEPSELNGGKFCEVVYTILRGAIDGTFASKAAKPSNMLDACRALEAEKADLSRVGDRSIRILIPRMLVALYEIRNNRGVGHTGGDVDPNHLDATIVYATASWILAELVRIFHNVSTKEAQETVDALIERDHPLIWNVPDTEIKRVLDPGLGSAQQALALLHQHPGWVTESDLCEWIEYSSASMFRKRVLEPAHKSRLIEFDRARSRVRISPRGVKEVEENILRQRKAA